MSNDLLWKTFLDKVQNSVNSMVYTTWFSKAKLVDIKGNKAIIIVPLDIHKKRLQETYYDLIRHYLYGFIVNNKDEVKAFSSAVDYFGKL